MLIHTHTRQIEWGDCDPAGIVFHPRYLGYFDHCTNLLFAKAGFDLATLQARFAVIGYPVVDLHSRFLAPCRQGDEVRIESWVAELRNSSFDVQHRLWRDDTLAVEATVTRVWTVQDPADPRRMQGRPVPEAIRRALSIA
ncbi:4-hydroxybenzoyl-CoA thioesterase [Franzmannia pantelleriensis]|uniref:4-hydroxybenzoyl-CoA thioesterase n=1 Tax=Franzmannia pantelleriensis TaxID=48727 RepID=A0A1G9SI29_9GAMM|nr:thioesterase family protein [Halomonas pantelleriensis]SDM35052.1 4-hydroxybenzoyl-CoA thioesterase [Halomonas pantelleriensis]